MIKVIEQTTAERDKEIRDLFHAIRPLLDEGLSYRKALVRVGRIPDISAGYTNRAWFRDLKEYGASQGYPFEMYGFRGKK